MGAETEKRGSGEQPLFDAAGGTSWSNHVKAVPDPAGGERKVLQGERVAKDYCQMTFTKEGGFLAVPAGFSGAVMLRVLVKGAGQVRVALVSGEKIKSYYQKPPATNEWCSLVLPLSQLQGKLAEGDRINDITVWLRPVEKGAVLETNAAIFLDRVFFDPAAAAPGTRAP